MDQTIHSRMNAEMFEDITELLTNGAGVYVFCNGDEVIYVGKSYTIYERISNHFRKRKAGSGFEFDRVFIRICEPRRTLQLEKEMIQKLRPKLNIIGSITECLE